MNYDKVEGKIRNLVRAMNRDGIIGTVASCQGHPTRGRDPYVYFVCPVCVAALIEHRLFTIWKNDEGLNYYWTLKGRFNGDFTLCFSLQSPSLEFARWSGFLPSVVTFPLRRRRIDADLAFLEKALDELLGALESGIVHDLPDQNRHHDNYEYGTKALVASLDPGLLSAGIGISAFRTWIIQVKENLMFADGTGDEDSHE